MNNQTRQTRSRTARQHDENATTTAMVTSRLTRAKAAAAGVEPTAALDMSKPSLTRKRAALGDLSNRNGSKDALKSKIGAANASTAANSSKLVSVKPSNGTNGANAKAGLLRPLKVATAANSNASESRRVLASKQTTAAEASEAMRPRAPVKVYTEKSTNGANGARRLPSALTSSLHENAKARVAKADQLKSKKTHRLEEGEPEVSRDVEQEATTRAAKRPKLNEAPKSLKPDWDDLDAEDMDDPLMVSEYAPEIFEFLYKLQKKYMPDPNYMDNQKSLEWDYRNVLVDWLVEVHTKFRLLPETLFLAVNIIDRFMSIRVVSLQKVQLVGIAALFIAAKYEEVYTPSVRNYAYVTDGGYNEEEILNAERYVLQELNFELSYPNPMNFLRRISKADDYDLETRTIGKYLMEISLFDHRMMKYCPSDVAGAAMFLSRRILNRSEWNANLVHYSGDCDEEKLYPIVALMVDYLASPVKHEAFFKKYASKRFMKASIVARTWAKSNALNFPLN
ncbi:G2/mitotic-specific cyclin-1 [Trichomonascus vanleenenianus]|uniref:cyclin family protein n=1 Tax=Trichomonascus vanleenenianus TaxID=2268995 RepID=UPI003EC9E2AB